MHKLNGDFMVNVDKILELSKECGVTQTALAKKIGRGSHYFHDLAAGKTTLGDERLQIIADALNTTVEYLTDQTDVKERKVVKIKVYGTIAAGIPIDAIEDVVDEEEIPAAMARDGEYLGLKIKGDSMEPLIHNGATAIIRKQPDCESGQIAAVYINGDEATLKRVFKRSNGITLVPENPEYAPMSFSSGENCPVAILGVLKEIRMKF